MTNTIAVDRPPPAADYPFASHYVKVAGHNVHYIEEGAGQPVLFVHGNPTSSYVYRNVMPAVAEATNRRCLAIDLLGFGKSDKPANIDYTLPLFTEIITGFIEELRLRDIILVAEDWGGFLGSYVMTKHPDWFQSAVLMETFLWPMTFKEDSEPVFVLPLKLMRSPLGAVFTRGMNIMVNKIIPEHCPMSEEALQAYKDALPTFASRKALGTFPKLIPFDGKPAASQQFTLELQAGLKNVTSPILWIKSDPGVIVSLMNPIGYGRLEELQQTWPQMVVRDFGSGYHFLTEERPDRVAEMISDWVIENHLNGSHAD